LAGGSQLVAHGLDHLRRAIQAFGDQLTAAGQRRAALVYYSGHGVQARGRNYLIPIGTSIHKEADLELQALDASTLMRQMEDAGSGVNILVLDACRNNPFQSRTRSLSKGLAQMKAREGEFFLAYATAPDTEAQDGSSAYSPYARALAAAMVLPGLPIEEAFKRVRVQVLRETGDQQQPWELSSLLTSFYFKPGAAPTSQAPPEVAPNPRPSEPVWTGQPPGGDTYQDLRAWATMTGAAADLDVHPSHGQSAEQTLKDKYECHKWAEGQTGYDPTDFEPTGNLAAYQRAMMACLHYRGYNVRLAPEPHRR
jgi:hypothetical protein